MTNKIFKRVVMCATCGLLLFSSISPNVVYAATTDTQVEDAGDIDTGDIIYHTDMINKTAECPGQISADFEIPDKFALNTYVRFQGENDNKIYQITASEDNGYSDFGFFPFQKYTVLECGVVDDNTNKYPCSIANGTTFEINDDETAYVIKITMDNYDEIKNTIEERENTEDTDNTKLSNTEQTLQDFINNEEIFKTGLDKVYTNTDGTLYYDFDSTSKNGHLYATGNCIQDFDIIIKIISDGVLGEAQYSVSIDGGNTFNNPSYTGSKVTLGATKMILYFALDEGKEFKKDETFKTHFYKSTKVTQSENIQANIVVAGTPTKNQDLTISFLTDGGRGKGKFQIINEKKANEKVIDTIPKNGIYNYDTVTIYFNDEDYSTKQTMAFSLKNTNKKTPIIPFIIIGVGILITIMIFFKKLTKGKTNLNDYKLHVYNDRQSSDKYK